MYFPWKWLYYKKVRVLQTKAVIPFYFYDLVNLLFQLDTFVIQGNV
ncbi:MAG: hypothetical protein H6Q13_829 [Bacteroidetes bacterium]|nr:hypothetical protein [Bacteroidota bacterium]